MPAHRRSPQSLTLEDYESAIRVHLGPHFAATPMHKIGRRDVEAFIAAQQSSGAAVKSIRNRVGLLHAIFTHAEREEWSLSSPARTS